MIVFGDPNDRFDHIWEAAATATSLLHRMIDLGRDDQLPGVLVEQPDDGLFDLLLGDDVAMADQHGLLWMAGGALRAAWLSGEASYSNTLSGESRLSEPSKAMASSFSEDTTRSIDLVWSISASIAACTVALPSVLPSAIC